jgi:hypothetical protein
MNPQAIADRLSRYVDDLLAAREMRSAPAIRGRTQLILRALEKLRTVHAKSPLPNDLISRIQCEKARAEVDLPNTSANYQNVCWDCWAHGKEVIVDRRVDAICKTCNWVQCFECGACRDPKSGGCPDRIFKDNRHKTCPAPRQRAIEPSWKHADVFPIIARIIEAAHGELKGYVTAQEIAARLLQDNNGRSLIEAAREQQEQQQSPESLASNMVSWFSQRITVGELEWARAFERIKIDGLWAYRPFAPASQ